MQLSSTFVPLWSAPEQTGDGLWLVFSGRDLLVLNGPEPALPTGAAAPVRIDRARCIGTLDGRPCWAAHGVEVDVGAEAGAAGKHEWLGLRALFERLPEAHVALAGRALQVLDFERLHRFCGVCGGRMEASDMGRGRSCTACGEVVYPRIAPAMMVLVTRKGARGPELLLARGPRFQTGMYSALAGFVEPGESLEDCVRRETREEVGVELGPLRYFGSQNWPFPHSLMVAFTAEWAGGEIACQEDEIEDARWFAIDALPLMPTPLSIARRLIDATVQELSSARG
ncbi:NAD(+) diphosphatase [Niveibacterium sp. SC-1]|uniref:NAD(+) diphosphatase n=1 Tax=Niveibacterium sp. SC-1 TaxID=3135646 RepID=UPI00311E14FF